MYLLINFSINEFTLTNLYSMSMPLYTTILSDHVVRRVNVSEYSGFAPLHQGYCSIRNYCTS